MRRGPAASAGLTFLASDALQRHRAQGLAAQWASHLLQTKRRQADVPGASPGLAPLTGDVATGLRTGCDQVLCSRQCVLRGPAVSADLTSPTSVAAQSCGGEHVLCSHQGVRKGPAASPGLTSLTSGAALCRRAVHDHVLIAIGAGVKGPAKSALGSPRGINAGPTMISKRGSSWLAAAGMAKCKRKRRPRSQALEELKRGRLRSSMPNSSLTWSFCRRGPAALADGRQTRLAYPWCRSTASPQTWSTPRRRRPCGAAP